MKHQLIKGRFFLFWLLGCLIIVSRRPAILFDPQLWAEDGFVFLDEAIKYGWASIGIPHAGYIHFLPRIITNLALQLSEACGQGITWVAFIMNLCAVALSSFCAVSICSSKFSWMGNIYFRMVLSFFILGFPNAYELWGNVTNLHWWLGILEFFLIWHMLQNKKMPNWGDTLLLSVVVLTSPNGLLVLPAILWAYFRERKNKLAFNLLKIILIFALTLIQLHFLLSVRIPKDMDIVLSLFNNTLHYVFNQLFGNLLVGRTFNDLTIAMIGAFFLFIIVLFSWKLFKKLYIPFAFLGSILVMTVLGTDLQSHDKLWLRYIFVPTVIIFSILMYEGRELWLNKKKHLFSIAKIALFALFFLLISLRVVDNYFIEPLYKHPWKAQTALFDREGKVFYHFLINPSLFSVAIPSSYDRKDYIPESLTKIDMDNSRIIKMHDIVVNDSLYTVVGPHPAITYQLPEKPFISYCWIDFDRSIEYLQFTFHPDNQKINIPDKEIFKVSDNNLIVVDERVQKYEMNYLHVHFYTPLSFIRQGALQDSSFVIKRFELYVLPSKINTVNDHIIINQTFQL
jgi:hypothetical protein